MKPILLTSTEIEVCRKNALDLDYYEDVDWGLTARKTLNVERFAREIEKAFLEKNLTCF